MKQLSQISKQIWRRTAPYLKQATPLIVCGACVALRCEAANSPLAKWLTDVSAEATQTWAVSLALIGLVVGIIGLKMDGGREVKGAFATLAGLCFLLLSVPQLVAYLQAE